MCRNSFETVDEAPPHCGNSPAHRRLLVPVGQPEDLDAALAYMPNLLADCPVKLAILHVQTESHQFADPARPGYAERLLEQAESRCRAGAIAHETHLFAGELVFSILDAAELLACDAIVMPLCQHRPWHVFFPTKTVREMERLRREIPLVLIDAHGAIIRSWPDEAV